MTPRTRVSSCLLVLGLACTDDPTSPPLEPPGIEEGELCKTPTAECVDEVSMLWCPDGNWTLTDCDSYCGSLGAGVTSPGCDTTLDVGAPGQLCACDPPSDGCYPNQGMCETEDVLAWCTDSYAWTTTSCTSLCEANSLLSLGCAAMGDAATCLCTNAGTPCTEEPSVCADLSTLSTCEAGLWAVVDCAEFCGGPASCDPGADGGATCTCDP